MNINIRSRQVWKALKLGHKANLTYDFKRRQWVDFDFFIGKQQRD